MTKVEKMEKAFNEICKVCELTVGLEPEDINENMIFGTAPESLKADDPKRKNYLGMDDVEMVKFMMYTEQQFNKEIDDSGFLPRPDQNVDDLWVSKTIKDLMKHCAENMLDD